MASLASVPTVSCVFLLFVCMMVAGEELSCPRLPSQPGSTPLDLSGLRFFLDPGLDPAIASALPFAVTVVDSSGPLPPFNSRESAGFFAVPSTVVDLPLHATATNQVYYAIRIQSTDESVINTFSTVTPSTGIIQPGITENITVSLCCVGTGRVTLVGCLITGTDSFQFLNGSYQTLGPFYFDYNCLAASSSCSSSFPSPSLVLVRFCMSPNQSIALGASPAVVGTDWPFLLGISGIDSRGLCIVDPGEDGVIVDQYVHNDENLRRIPIPFVVNELQFYIVKSEKFQTSTPISYNLTLSSGNTSVLNLPTLSIPTVGLLNYSQQYFDISMSCNDSGLTTIWLILNFTTFIKQVVIQDTYNLYFYKECTPPPLNDTVITSSQGLTVPVIVAIIVVPIVFVIVIVVILVMVIVGVTCRQKRQTEQLEQLAKEQLSSNLYSMTTVQNPFEFLDQYEIEYNFALLEVVDQIGQGAFGRVFKARAPGLQRGAHKAAEFVAVKSLKDDGKLEDFCKEVKVCVQFDHDNVIRLLGVCTVSAQKCMIFEYMDQGSLHDMLHQSVPNNPSYDCDSSSPLIRSDNLLHLAIQLSRGLEYLSTLNFVHRDIATRNCLVDSSFNAKIADFGLSRDISAQNYYRIGNAKAYLPIRWMPPEALLYGKFTLKSDVWSFAVLMWEIYTFGKLPYLGFSDHEAIDHVKEARGLENPPLCPLGVYSIMRSCWTRVPSQRPTMRRVREQLEMFGEGKLDSYVNLVPGRDTTNPVPTPVSSPPSSNQESSDQ